MVIYFLYDTFPHGLKLNLLLHPRPSIRVAGVHCPQWAYVLPGAEYEGGKIKGGAEGMQ